MQISYNGLVPMLLIDKPIGITSFDVVSAIRKATGIKKVGHAGTLDPLASGLMLVLVGKEETRRAQEFLGLDKTYAVTIRLGERRDTGDLEGEIVAHDTNMPVITRETIQNALYSMIGTLKLPVPAYSAIKCNGQRLYKKARKGQNVDLPVRDMNVFGVTLKDIKEVLLWDSFGTECWRGYEIDVVFTVASGVYIRSLSEELGKRLGYPATTSRLRRLAVGNYMVKNAYDFSCIGSDMVQVVL